MTDSLLGQLVVAMARHMVTCCYVCEGTGDCSYTDYSTPERVTVVKPCPRCSELLTLLKQVEP